MYERFDLMFAAEGPVPDEILVGVLKGFRTITLVPPFNKQIALISPVNFPVAVFNGRMNEAQPYLGVYRSAGVLSSDEFERIRNTDQFMVDFVGSLECQVKTLHVRGRFCSHELAEGTIILVVPGDQQGPYFPTIGGNVPKLFDVGRESGPRVFRAEYSTHAERDFLKEMMSELAGEGRVVKLNDEPDEKAVVELICDLSDDELRKLRNEPNATAAELDSFRKFARRRCHE